MVKGELPRLSGSLRAFGDICAPWAKNLQRDPDDLARKQQEVYDKQSKAHSLETVKEFLLSNSTIHETAVVQLIKKLRILSRNLMGSDASTSQIEAACLFLLETFKSSQSVGQKEKVKMKTIFGAYPENAVEEAFELVKAIVESIKEEACNKFLQNDCETGDEYLEEEEFGNKIKFLDQEPLDKSFYFMQNNFGKVKKIDIFEKLTFKFNGNSDAKPIQVKELTVNTTASTSSSPKYDRHWLESEIKKFYPSELAPSILSMLKSDKTNESLQGELFDLLGFDRYELITDILKHRAAIIADKSKTANETAVQQKNAPDKPSYLCQVTIQSEAEKMLTKQIRKDEKRISKVQAHASATEETPAVLDAKYLKAIRESQLSVVRNMPHLPQGPKYIPQRKSYPNVYDLYTEVTMSAAFVSGRKLGLPEGHRRIDNPKYEEINIPAAKRMSASFKKDRIAISSLDNVGKAAFSGMKELNLIQSMVFKTAYNTNENMLVCAPTGAGKTNVAMLTIIHEIRNNMEGDTVKKDKFKIVYVAPMKALASEMVKNFGKRLQSIGIQVKELTGDMQLTKNEIMQTQMLVTTPEKWDVVTRKSTGDVALTQLVKLLILDEVHLLDSDRGPVLEAIVARTLRQVESTQSMIRILGLSATLPNYIDVARFLRVNAMTGLFFFDDRFRPVPLSPTFIGVKSHNPMQQAKDTEEVCYDKVLSLVQDKHQVMVFVHARKATVTTATILKDFAVCRNHIHLFTDKEGTKEFGVAQKQLQQYSKNKELRELFNYGFSIHHAGMLRHDRDRVERYFSDGLIKVLVCTSTLAWGVNLPARAVVIKGTEIYDSKHGSFIDLGVLDVMQIFGRAGRPQFDNHGEGIIITEHKKLQHYLSLLTRQHQIESKFRENLEDNLNAEIGLGTVTNISEGVEWLSYTYLYIRMLSNPLAYGLKAHLIQDDFQLQNYRKQLIVSAAMNLDKAKMIRYDDRNGYLHITDLGRTASHYYISKETVSRFHEELKTAHMNDGQILHLVSVAKEFDQLKVREDEMNEMDHLLNECLCPVKGGCVETEGKVNILIQTYLTGMKIEGFSLISDQVYVMQNATRIIRFLFEAALRKSWAMRASAFLRMSKMFERRLWDYQTPLRQFSDLSRDTLAKIDRLELSTEELMDLHIDEIALKTHCQKDKHTIKNCLIQIPNVKIEPQIQPITHKILRLTLYITPDFKWVDKVHGHGTEPFWIWIEDPETDMIYHFEYFMLTKKQVITKEVQTLVITLPLEQEVRCDLYFVRVISDRWLGSDRTIPIRFKNLILPHHYQPQTELLDLQPLPVRALQDRMFEMLYTFEYFNPIQTQIFHTLYHTDHNVLLGAPTGSGKTIAAEMAMFRLFKSCPGMKVVYIAPLKALVRERMEDWKIRFVEKLQKRVVELTGDVTPDMKAVASADVIVTTPEKWDGISRSWQTRSYVKTVGLIVIDEIHLLGEDRGPVLEVIVSRTNFISGHTEKKVRVVGLSTALANATDLAEWLGIKDVGLYNFKQSVRPVPLEIHVSGYPGKHYCPRMALMNKPTYQAIRTHSPDKPTLVFVSSRRQTRLTALDLIAYLAAEDNPRQWVHMPEEEGEMMMSVVRDQNLKLTLAFGIGLHHAGLHEQDRKLCETLFLKQKIQVLIATATLAWGVNLPAHLVVIKGTEYFDGKVQRYVDFPITDVLQMMGRAGRPQFDDHGIAVVLVQDIKKGFYKKFLYDPFPVESSLIQALPDHLNAEIVAGTISSKQQALDYLTWTFFFRRLLKNPVYYGLESIEPQTVNHYLSGLVNRCLNLLQTANCITVHQDERQISSTILGHIASYYYLSHKTLDMFRQHLTKDVDMDKLLWILCEAHEYDEIPVRHNEDGLNGELAKSCPKEVNPLTYDNSHTKTNLLLQAHFCQLSLPCTDYYTDLKSVLDQAIRIIQAMVDVSSDAGFLNTTLGSILFLQMVLQARWYDENALLTLPHVDQHNLHFFRVVGLDPKASGRRTLVDCLPELMEITANRYEVLASALRNEFSERNIQDIFKTLHSLPRIEVRCSITGYSVKDQGLKTKKLTLHRISGVTPESCRYAVYAKREYILDVTLSRLNKGKRDKKAIAPKFPKQKDEGWFLVLGNIDSQELLAMKRIPFVSRSSTHQLVFYAPEKKCNVKFTLFLMSDCYLGLDQQYDIYFEVKDPIIVPDMEDEEMDSSESSSENSDDD